ncbi:hypothetical protein [uncultured Vagococcus sp.]|uniref:hypothetical protein n=1 Tax=uncultured Vagococcus sp. TaxID=189676 RepID=UPI0028D37A12|nr:hypothetical protein [uncultured Vagococcus sp.]
MSNWTGGTLNPEVALLNMKKTMEKNLIVTFVAIAASTRSRQNEKRVQEKVADIQEQTKESLTAILASLESSLKGKFGKQAKKLLKENAKKFK